MRSPRLALAILASLLLGAAPASVPESVRGTYRLQGTARVALGAMFNRDAEVHADAVLDQGEGARDVRVHVAAEGYGCDLRARLDAGGALTFLDDQRCAVTISSPDARGRLDARIRSARGRVDGGHLVLELSGDVEGALRRRTGGVRVLGQEIPASWTPELPVRGSVEALAEGDMDHSRAAAR